MLRITAWLKFNLLSGALLLGGMSSNTLADPVECFETSERSYCAVVLSPALQLHTGIDAIEEVFDPWRLEIRGAVRLVAADLELSLAESNLVLEVDGETGVMTEFYGTAKLPLDEWQPLQDAHLSVDPPMAVIGLFQAETIDEIFDGELPLNTGEGLDGSERESQQPYLLFHTNTGGLSMDLNEAFGLGMGDKSTLALNLVEGQSTTFAVDVIDPYLFSGQGFSASLTVKSNGDEPAKLQKAKTFTAVSYTTTDEYGDVDQEIIEYYDDDGKLVSKFMHDPADNAMVKHDIDAAGRVSVSFYQRDDQGDFVREGADKSSGDYFNLVELDNGADVNDRNRQRMTGYRTTSYAVTDQHGKVSQEVVEYHDAKGRRVNKFIFDPASGSMTKQDFDQDGHLTVSFYAQDAAGDFVREGGDKYSGDYFSAAELAKGADVNDKSRPRDTNSADNPDGKGKNRDKFAAGIDAFAFSYHGWIPFAAQTTFGVPVDSREFSGQLYMKGAVPFFHGALVLDGETITYIGENGFVMGGNGDLAFTLPGLPDFIDFSLYLGSATAVFQISPDRQMTYLSGVLEPDTQLFEGILPLSPSGKMQAVGYMDGASGDAHITLQGAFNLGADLIGKLIGVDLQSLQNIQGYASISTGGVVIHGVTRSQIHPFIEFSGDVEVDAEFSWLAPENFVLRLAGSADVYGVGLKEVSIEINGTGLYVNGIFVTPLNEIAMFGAITDRGPSLSGYATVELGLGGITKAMQDASAAISSAQKEVSRLTTEVSRQRAIVQAERDAHAQALRDARAKLTAAQSRVNSLNASISYEYRMISARRAQIKSWYSWYKKAKWYQKAGRYARYVAEKAWRTADIARRYTTIASYKVAMTVANAALSVAKTSLHGLEAATVLTPVDLDPRVAGLVVAKEVAMVALEVAKAPFKDIPLIEHDFEGRIEAKLDIHGLSGSVMAVFDGYEALHGWLDLSAKPQACIDIPGMGAACTRF